MLRNSNQVSMGGGGQAEKKKKILEKNFKKVMFKRSISKEEPWLQCFPVMTVKPVSLLRTLTLSIYLNTCNIRPSQLRHRDINIAHIHILLGYYTDILHIKKKKSQNKLHVRNTPEDRQIPSFVYAAHYLTFKEDQKQE